jgi:5-methylcytosine-specific restriction endonuclease McrA
MRAYRFDHLSDTELLHLLARLVAESRENTAKTVAVISEVDRRRLYLPAGYTSMKAYCIEALGLSEDAAFKRIQVARAVDEFPVLLEMLADGRLHLTGANMLVPHLTADNQSDLLAGATRATKAEIHDLLTTKFPIPDLLTVPSIEGELAPAQVETPELALNQTAESVRPLAPAQVARVVTNLAPRRVAFYLVPETKDRIRRVKELLGHELPSGDDAMVVDWALRQAIARLEKRKHRVTRAPRARQADSSSNARHIPKRVKRAVWERDGGQCTFVGNGGHRCGTRRHLEFDHVQPVARGGSSTAENLRLRCRAHNQFEADRAFGEGFMHQKREAALAECAAHEAERKARAKAAAEEVIPWLRALGLRADESRRAAALTESIADAPLEERVRLALTRFGPRSCSHTPAPSATLGI